MKFTKDGIVYYLDSAKAIALVESFQDDAFNEVHIPPLVNGFVVRHICSRAFRGNKHIQKVFLPNTITKINAEAFAECYFLEKLHFYKANNRSRQLEIGYRAFAACPKLTEITSDSDIIVSCEKDVFYNCVRLEKIQLYLFALDNHCFENCFELNNLLFSDCALWKTGTFKGCSNIKNVTFFGDVEELLSDTCMKWISKRNVKCKKNTSIAELVYTGTHVEFI